MFALAFDMSVNSLRKHYGDPYNNAYYEIMNMMDKYGFYNAQGSVYLSEANDMVNLFRAMVALRKIDWFRFSVRDIRAFRVEDWSDFTQYFQE